MNNICEVNKLSDLIYLLKKNTTVILGITIEETCHQDRVNIRKFLKVKAQKFSSIYFVYMNVSNENMGTLGIISKDSTVYPLLFHIRNGTDVLVRVENATLDKMNESFEIVEKYYIVEMTNSNNTNNVDDKIEKKN